MLTNLLDRLRARRGHTITAESDPGRGTAIRIALSQRQIRE